MFLPWHREFLRRFELELQKVHPDLTLPYWDWTEDSSIAVIWSDELLGGNGDELDGWRVKTGQFAYGNKKWPIREDLGGPALKRAFGETIVPGPGGASIAIHSLPTKQDVQLALREVIYDTNPWNCSPFTRGFRNRLEGWITQEGDYKVVYPGSQLHNRVHLWVGGSMVEDASPNDPAFFLHHCFVDKIWADWQAVQQQKNPDASPHYLPKSGGPPGHNLNDPMHPWGQVTPADVLDHHALGYSYDTEGELHLQKLSVILDSVRSNPFTQ